MEGNFKDLLILSDAASVEEAESGAKRNNSPSPEARSLVDSGPGGDEILPQVLKAWMLWQYGVVPLEGQT